MSITSITPDDLCRMKDKEDLVLQNCGGDLQERIDGINNMLIEEEEKQKPDCELVGQDGNIFNLMGIASRTLHRNSMVAEAAEMCTRIRASDNYHKVLGVISEYVNIIDSNEGMNEHEDFDFTQSI